MSRYTPAGPPPARGFSRRGLWVWGVFLALLAASHAVQAVVRSGGSRAGDVLVHIPALGDEGAVAGGSQSLAVYRWGSGASRRDRPPVVLLHGSPGSGSHFVRLGPLLADAGYEVLAPDLPGFGGSGGAVPSYSILAQARSVLAMLDALGIGRAHVVGWSQGGGTGLHMADLAPERVASLTLMASIGVQEAEGSGSYHFEHAKYALGYAGLVLGGELVPHFGLLGSFDDRRAFIRSFWDSDQRPLRELMARLGTPTLVLHGRDDFLTPAWGAEVSHELIGPSRLVVLEASHFLPFIRPEQAAGHLLAFVGRHDAPGERALRQSVVLAPPPDGASGALDAAMLWWQRHAPWWLTSLALGLLAWWRPEATAAAAAVASAMGWLDAGVASAALAGGLGARSAWAWLRGRGGGPPLVASKALPAWGREFDTGRVGLALRTRLQPWRRDEALAAAGAGGRGRAAIAAGAGVGTLAWVALAFLPAWLFAAALRVGLGESMWTLAAGLVVAVLTTRSAVFAATWIGRQRIKATLRRAAHHEFWPAWAFYAPLPPWLAWLSLRYGGAMTFTCANPAIDAGGGVVGESKLDILRALAGAEGLLPAVRIAPGEARERLGRLQTAMAGGEVPAAYPIVLKPDQGQRGYAVRVARGESDALDYLSRMERAVVAQAYHPGPVEVGCMWMRDADAPEGRIGRVFSMNTKDLPDLVGDGRRTVEQLIYRHRRFRCQADIYLARFAHRRLDVLGAGERLRLVYAGNHAQGAIFRDAGKHITPELEAWVDRAAAAFSAPAAAERAALPPGDNGLDFGRFDIRAESIEKLRRAEGLAIIELNGTSAESTNVYDPDRSVWWAWGVLLHQWRELYRLGARRRAAGVRTMGPLELRRAWREFDRDRPAMRVAD